MNSFSISFKAFALVALLSVLNVSAMQKEPDINASANVTPTNSTTIESKVVRNSKPWAITKAITDSKNAFVKAVTDMKTRGWSNWSTKERAGVVIAGSAIVAVVVYLGIKAYESFTAPKTKVKKAATRA